MRPFICIISILLLTIFLSACDSHIESIDKVVTIDKPNNIDTTSSVNDVKEAGTQREKQIVKLAMIGTNLPSSVIKDFNQYNEDYYVEAIHYSSSDPMNLDEAILKFNVDISAGTLPDIVLMNRNIQTNDYITKGFFADLNELIDNDPHFDRTDYLPFLFEMFDRNGKMYEISSQFVIHAIQAKTSDVGTDNSWTLAEFAAYIESKPNTEYIICDLTKRDFIINMTQSLLINPISGEINFDHDEFKKILSISERFPTDMARNYDRYNQNDYDRLRQGAKDGNPLMMTIFVANFLTVKYQENLYFQEETTIKGWPSSGGNGIRFFSAGYFSIVKPSKNPDGAWEFLKYILDNNTSPHNTMLPVNLSLLHEFAEDEYNRWSDNNVIQIGDTIVDGYSRADTDKLIELCKSVSTLDRSNPVITRIIDEEIGIYLNGQKSADEVINIIENRINIYLAVQD